MTFVIAAPETLVTAASDVVGIDSTLRAASSLAAVPTATLTPAAGDEVSAAIASLFSGHAQIRQSLLARAQVFHQQFVQALNNAGISYAAAEAVAATSLQNLDRTIVGLVNGSANALLGRPLIGTGAQGSGNADNGRSAAVSSGSGRAGIGGSGTSATGAGLTGAGSGNAATGGTGGSGPAGGASAVSSVSLGATGTGGATTTYSVTSHWGNGFIANYTITNSGTTPLTNWQLQFKMPANESVPNLWNGQLAQSGNQYTVSPVSWTQSIAPVHSDTIGFQATQNGAYSAPTHVLLNGHSISGGGTGTLGAADATTGSGIAQTPFEFSQILEQPASAPQT